MRIGEAASLSGLSARMIRYYEQRGVVRGARARDGHRRYTDDDVRRLRRLRALLAANIAPECAERAAADVTTRARGLPDGPPEGSAGGAG